MIDENSSDKELVSLLEKSLSEMELVDPKAYRDWKRRVLYLAQDVERDLRQAKRWAEFEK
jgi:hypothetical protein